MQLMVGLVGLLLVGLLFWCSHETGEVLFIARLAFSRSTRATGLKEKQFWLDAADKILDEYEAVPCFAAWRCRAIAKKWAFVRGPNRNAA